jgi:hypothetical protein
MTPATDWQTEIKEQLKFVLEEEAKVEDDTPPNHRTRKEAYELIAKVYNKGAVKPTDIYTSARGEIVFVWQKLGKKLEAWIMPTGSIENFLSGEAKDHTFGEAALFQALQWFSGS